MNRVAALLHVLAAALVLFTAWEGLAVSQLMDGVAQEHGIDDAGAAAGAGVVCAALVGAAVAAWRSGTDLLPALVSFGLVLLIGAARAEPVEYAYGSMQIQSVPYGQGLPSATADLVKVGVGFLLGVALVVVARLRTKGPSAA